MQNKFSTESKNIKGRVYKNEQKGVVLKTNLK